MNKYTKMFMDDNNLKVGDEFRKKGTDAYYIWHFNKDGRLINKKGDEGKWILSRFLLGEFEVEKVKKGPWKPRPHEKYWFVSQYGCVVYNNYYNDKDVKYILAHTTIFQTKDEAEDYKWFLGKVDEYKKPFEYGEKNYLFYYDYDDDALYITFDIASARQGAIYFNSYEETEAFIEEVGKDRIKKYMFGIYE